jgi:hypothetical protein
MHEFGGVVVTIVSLCPLDNNDVDASKILTRYLCKMKCKCDCSAGRAQDGRRRRRRHVSLLARKVSLAAYAAPTHQRASIRHTSRQLRRFEASETGPLPARAPEAVKTTRFISATCNADKRKFSRGVAELCHEAAKAADEMNYLSVNGGTCVIKSCALFIAASLSPVAVNDLLAQPE